MLNPPTFQATHARRGGGFTLVELLVVIGIIAILAGVALGPITKGLVKARENAAVQSCRTIALGEFQYQNDNQAYPDGATAEALAAELVTGGYVSDPNIFYIAADTNAVKPTTIANFKTAINNVSYDFAGCQGAGANPAPAGVPVTASDLTPLVWTEGDANLNTAGIPVAADTGSAFAPLAGIFGTDGVAVCYKGNNSVFRTVNTNPAQVWPTVASKKAIFVDQGFDPQGTTFVMRTGPSLQ